MPSEPPNPQSLKGASGRSAKCRRGLRINYHIRQLVPPRGPELLIELSSAHWAKVDGIVSGEKLPSIPFFDDTFYSTPCPIPLINQRASQIADEASSAWDRWMGRWIWTMEESRGSKWCRWFVLISFVISPNEAFPRGLIPMPVN